MSTIWPSKNYKGKMKEKWAQFGQVRIIKEKWKKNEHNLAK